MGILGFASASGIHCSITTVANGSASPNERSLWTLIATSSDFGAGPYSFATSSDGVVIISFVSSDFGAGPYSFVSSDFGAGPYSFVSSDFGAGPTRRTEPYSNDCD